MLGWVVVFHWSVSLRKRFRDWLHFFSVLWCVKILWTLLVCSTSAWKPCNRIGDTRYSGVPLLQACFVRCPLYFRAQDRAIEQHPKDHSRTVLWFPYWVFLALITKQDNCSSWVPNTALPWRMCVPTTMARYQNTKTLYLLSGKYWLSWICL